ncbi:MAG: hypothetical protein ACI8W7_003031 [Gammaproteobacteria bacterium]|jgi:hypothetical protein
MDRAARNDAIAALMMFAVVAVFGSVTSQIFVDPRDPGFGAQDFPVMVLVMMTALALGLGGLALVRLASSGWRLYEAGEAGPVLRYLLPMLLLGFVYVWLLELFQYVLPTFCALTASLAIFGNRGLFRLVGVPLIVTALFYILFFGVFGLNEPEGVLLSYESGSIFRPLRTMIGL